jgi:hypothetical protein
MRYRPSSTSPNGRATVPITVGFPLTRSQKSVDLRWISYAISVAHVSGIEADMRMVFSSIVMGHRQDVPLVPLLAARWRLQR